MENDLIIHEQGHATPYLRIQPSGSLKEFESISIDLNPLYDRIVKLELELTEARKDSARIDYLKHNEKIAEINGEPVGLAAVVLHHIDMDLREAIDLLMLESI